MIRVCLYARYSTDLQNDKSNEDQLRDLREFLSNIAPSLRVDPSQLIVGLVEQDAAKSGATIFQRAGLRRVRAAAASGAFDVLVTETPNRLARKVGESGLLYDELRYHHVRWFTITMGEMDPMKVGMMGAISQQNLEEGKHFTRRGLRGCIEDGRSAGGLSFGYRLDRTQKRISRRGQEEIVRGVLVIDPEQAAIVVRIYRLFGAGMSSKAIARLLNAEGIRGPRGRVWRASTIHGNQTTGTGILNNVLYLGQLRHGLREYRMNPETGLRGRAVMNPATAVKVKDVPHLRIVDDELWRAVKTRQAATKRAQREGLDRARRPRFLFSKLTKCGFCGGGFTTESRDELRCNNYIATRGQSICTNGRVIKRKEVERRVLGALQERFLTPERLEEFTRVYVAETNRLRADHRGKVAAAPRELEAVKRRALEILNWMREGYVNTEWKAELARLDQQREELEATIAAAASQPQLPTLHPSLAGVFEQKVRALAAALEHEDLEQRESARSTLRGFIDRIVIPPGDELLQVVGNLGEMMTAADGRAPSAAVGNGGCGGRI